MLANGVADLGGLPGGGGIVAAHDALLARELDHGAGDEVRLTEVRGTNRVGGNALLDCFVYGRIAGTNAGKEQSW